MGKKTLAKIFVQTSAGETNSDFGAQAREGYRQGPFALHPDVFMGPVGPKLDPYGPCRSLYPLLIKKISLKFVLYITK